MSRPSDSLESGASRAGGQDPTQDGPRFPGAGFIPELFFDLIGRIAPGAAFLVGLLVIVSPSSTSSLERLPNFPGSAWLAALLFSYIAGVIFREIWEVFCLRGRLSRPDSPDSILRDFREHAEAVSLLRSRGVSGGTSSSLPAVDKWWMRFDHLRSLQVPEGSRLVKILAETHFCESLIPGTLILLLVNFLKLLYEGLESWPFRLAIALILVAVTYLLYRWRLALWKTLKESSLRSLVFLADPGFRVS